MHKPDPDAALKALEAELAAQRALRHGSSAGRTAFRVWSIVIVLALILGSLLILQYLVSQIPTPEERKSQAVEPSVPGN